MSHQDELIEKVAAALVADVWTTPKPEIGPEWHMRFPRWKAERAARLAVVALREELGLIPHAGRADA